MPSAIARAYSGPTKLISSYWATYGGWTGFFASPYFHASLLLLLVTAATWTSERWWEQVWTIVPSLLGFSLGALAIFLGFGSETFRNVISGKQPGKLDSISPYMSVTAAFTHFIVVQVASLLLAVCSVALHGLDAPSAESVLYVPNLVGRWVLWGGGYWLFLYALCLALASVFAVFRIAGWFDAHRTDERAKESMVAAPAEAKQNERKS